MAAPKSKGNRKGNRKTGPTRNPLTRGPNATQGPAQPNRGTVTRARPVQAMAVPRPGDLRNTLASLARGRVASGSLASTIANLLTKGTGQGLTRVTAARAAGARGAVPASARPVTPPTPEMLRRIEEMVFRRTVARRTASEPPMDTSVGAAVRDVVKNPDVNWLQGSAAETVWQMKGAMKNLNAQRMNSGQPPIDFPGRRGFMPDGLRIGPIPPKPAPKVDPKIRTPARGRVFRPGARLDPSQVVDRRIEGPRLPPRPIVRERASSGTIQPLRPTARRKSSGGARAL